MISLFFEELRSSIGNCETAISQSSIRPLLEQNETDEGIYRSPAAQRLLGFVCVFLNTEKLSKRAFIFSLAGEEAAMDLISSLILSRIYIEGAMLVIGVLKNSPRAKVSLPLLQTHFFGIGVSEESFRFERKSSGLPNIPLHIILFSKAWRLLR